MDTVFHGLAGELRIGEPELYVDNRARHRSGHMSHAMAASAEPTAHCLLKRITKPPYFRGMPRFSSPGSVRARSLRSSAVKT